MFHVLVGNGHRMDDLQYKYTIDQVNLFYEKQVMRDMESWYMDAVITGNAMAYSTPSTDTRQAHKKNEGWKKFVESFEWSKIHKQKQNKSQLTVGNVLNSLGITGFIKVKEGDK